MESARQKSEQTKSEPVSGRSPKTLTPVTTSSRQTVIFSDAQPPAVQLQPVVRPSQAVIQPAIQTKLTVNEPGDQYEQEADRLADRVMRMPDSNIPLQHKCSSAAGGPGTPSLESVRHSAQLRRSITPTDMSSAEPPAIVHDVLRSSGQPLNESTRAFLEPRFGHDFADVRVHTDSRAAESARAVEAQAYTVGRDVVFGAGQYAPEATQGRQLLAHELAHVVQQRGQPAGVVQCFRVTATASVPSMVIEDWSTNRVPAKWSQLRNKLTLRDRTLNQRLAILNASDPAVPILNGLLSRWPFFRTNLAPTSGFDPAAGTLPAATAIAAARTDELSNRSALSGTANRFVRAAITEFVTALDAYLADRTRLDGERTEFHRFDPLFTAPDVTTLLGAIPHANFTTADVKALVGQETADLTNINVHGITTGRPGITTSHPNRHGFHGLGQHSATARNEAITWAAANGVVIPPTPDPRHDPALSIQLTAAYFGRVMDMLWPGLPNPKPAGDELKKLVFAAYNGGPTNVTAAARSFLNHRTVAYTWTDIKMQPTISAQMRNYVEDIVHRLS